MSFYVFFLAPPPRAEDSNVCTLITYWKWKDVEYILCGGKFLIYFDIFIMPKLMGIIISIWNRMSFSIICGSRINANKLCYNFITMSVVYAIGFHDELFLLGLSLIIRDLT